MSFSFEIAMNGISRKISMYSPVFAMHRFKNYLPYKSDEMAHVAFPDEFYNKPKLSNMQRWSLRCSTNVNDNGSCGAAFTVN